MYCNTVDKGTDKGNEADWLAHSRDGLGGLVACGTMPFRMVHNPGWLHSVAIPGYPGTRGVSKSPMACLCEAVAGRAVTPVRAGAVLKCAALTSIGTTSFAVSAYVCYRAVVRTLQPKMALLCAAFGAGRAVTPVHAQTSDVQTFAYDRALRARARPHRYLWACRVVALHAKRLTSGGGPCQRSPRGSDGRGRTRKF